jgi:hypothetical protein
MDALKAIHPEALEEVARIDARVRDRLLKRARKQGMTSQDEVIKLVEVWNRAAARADRKHRQHKGH